MRSAVWEVTSSSTEQGVCFPKCLSSWRQLLPVSKSCSVHDAIKLSFNISQKEAQERVVIEEFTELVGEQKERKKEQALFWESEGAGLSLAALPATDPVQQQLPDAMRAHAQPAFNSGKSSKEICVFHKVFLLVCFFQFEISWCGAWVWGCTGEEAVVQNEGLQKWLAVNKN